MSGSSERFRKLTDDEFLDEVSQGIEELESFRLEMRSLFIKRIFIGVLIFLPCIFVAMILDGIMQAILSFEISIFSPVTFFGVPIWVLLPMLAYKKAYKDKFLTRIATMFGDLNYCTDVNKEFEFSRNISKSQALPACSKHTEDYFYGNYKGCEIEFSELRLSVKDTSKDSAVSEVTVFSGLCYLVSLPRNFHGHTILVKNGSKLVEIFTEARTGLEKVNLVDPEFEEFFDVYSDDQVEARYLIDLRFIEKYKSLMQDSSGVGGVLAEYYEGKLLLLTSREHGLFDVAKLSKEADNRESLLSLRHDLLSVFDVIDGMEIIQSKN